MNLTNLYGKQVFALYEGEIIGTVVGATFNKTLNKIKSFKIFDNEENEYELQTKNIKAMSDNIVISNKSKLNIFIENQALSPMFKPVIDSTGTSLGKINDANIDFNGNVINYITSTSALCKPEHIYIRKDFIYFCEEKFKINNLKPKNISSLSLPEIKVKILNFSKTDQSFLPAKAKFSPKNLIGKTAKSDLVGTNNEIIIKANQQITEKIVEEASRHNRLNQLFYIAV